MIDAGTKPLVDPDAPMESDKSKAPSTRVATKRTTSGRASKAVQLDAIRETMMGGFVMIGMGLVVPLPLTGHTVIAQSEELTASLIAWGKTSPRVANALLSLGKGAGAFAVLGAAAPIVVAAMSEAGVLPRALTEKILPNDVHEYIPPDRNERWTDGEGIGNGQARGEQPA